MALTPSDRDEIPRVEVRIHEGDRLVHTEQFPDLETAEAFAEDWTEHTPGARVTFVDLAGADSLDELVEDESLLPEEGLGWPEADESG